MSTQPTSRYAMGSVANMLRSLLVIGAMMAAIVLMVPRVNSVSQPSVDVDTVARGVAAQVSWPVETPGTLPEEWRATSVRYERSTDGVLTWHAGYLTPDNQSIAIEQAVDATPTWIRAQVNRGAKAGQIDAGGRTWVKYVREGKLQNSIVHEPTAPGQPTTILTGTATFEQLASFAGMLQVVKPSGAAGSTPSTATSATS